MYIGGGKTPPPFIPMNVNNPIPDDSKIAALLREARVAPALPPRLQEDVWRRIADAEAGKSVAPPTWLDILIAGIFRPRFALAAVSVLVIVGALLGLQQGNQLARQDAQARYLAAVAPNSLR